MHPRAAAVDRGEWLYEPQARARHHVDARRTSARYFVRRCWQEGRGKASLVRLVGREGLDSEWGYTLRTLPTGVARGLGQAARGDLGGASRAVAIVIGLAVTTGGYVAGLVRPERLRQARCRDREQSRP